MRAAVDRGSRQRKETGIAEAIDDVDRNILAVLQEDASLALEEIARRVGASKTPVWNRIRKMKERGIIRGEVAIVDPEKIGLESCFFVLIRTSQHDAAWLEKFLHAVQARPEVLEAHRLAGDIDYILKVRVANARAYDAFYQALISEVKIFNVTALLSMEEIKSTTVLPIAP
jgi:Lrp/AsnC family transcriptional regulator